MVPAAASRRASGDPCSTPAISPVPSDTRKGSSATSRASLVLGDARDVRGIATATAAAHAADCFALAEPGILFDLTERTRRIRKIGSSGFVPVEDRRASRQASSGAFSAPQDGIALVLVARRSRTDVGPTWFRSHRAAGLCGSSGAAALRDSVLPWKAVGISRAELSEATAGKAIQPRFRGYDAPRRHGTCSAREVPLSRHAARLAAQQRGQPDHSHSGNPAAAGP